VAAAGAEQRQHQLMRCICSVVIVNYILVYFMLLIML
jgi:hypothetical protein